jgi:tetratricopeptide (TPR) repeat protein
VGDAHQRFGVLGGLQEYYRMAGELQIAAELAEQLLDLARRTRDPALLSRAHLEQAESLFWRGEFLRARENCALGLAFCDLRERHSRAPRVSFLALEARILVYLGYPDQAAKRYGEALALARELSHPFTLAMVLFSDDYLRYAYGDAETLAKSAEAVVRISVEHGIPSLLKFATGAQGRVLIRQGRVQEGIDRMLDGVAACQAAGQVEAAKNSMVCLALAEGYGKLGRIEEGLSALDRGLATSSQGWERAWEAELHRLKGELLLMREEGEAGAGAAETCFQQALTIARSHSARWWELRAATSLSRLWQRQGREEEARALLQGIYDWFTEGFGTADMKDARALLEKLTAR